MADIRIGGDPESYMEAPVIGAGGGGKGGGGSFIAMVLDLLGIHKQVAKDPAEGSTEVPKSGAGDKASKSKPKASAPPAIPILNEAESALPSVMPTDWGRSYLDSIKPLRTIDPNKGF